MALSLVAGALIGSAVSELLAAIKDARRKISSFEPILKRLESTLVAITPRLHEITLLNKKLHHHSKQHHQSGIADLIILARDGKELVAKCSKISHLNYVRKVQYSKMLHDLDCSLLRYFDTVLQLDQLKDTKQILLVLKDMHCKLFPLDNDNDVKSRLIDDEIRSLSNLGGELENDLYAEEPEKELDEITVKMENQADGSTSFERAIDMAVLDDIIARLLEFRKGRSLKQVQLTESEIRQLCIAARDIFLQQPILLELEAPMKICGDISGQYGDLLRLFEYGGFPPQSNYLFLGNYVDHGKQSLETICLLLCFKIKYPDNFFLLRGNHECASSSRIYGFYDECKRRFNVRLWKTFIDCFNCLPVAALIDDKILCMHGGLSPDLEDLDQIRNIPRPTDVPDVGLLCDLLWSDPCSDVKGWGMNDRGVSYTFGPDKVSQFVQMHDMDLICRAHQVVEDGYEFFADRRLVTIFSAPCYCGEYDNAGAVMSIDESLMCSFQILRPARS